MAEGEREGGEAPVGKTNRTGPERFRYEYGAQPLHLIAMIAGLALSGYALLRITDLPEPLSILIWIVAGALLHDLVALPLYSLFNVIADTGTGRAIESRAQHLHALNHIRIPAGLSLLLLLVYFPLILQMAPEEYFATTGQETDVYLARYLLICAAMFLISGLIYAVRLRRGIPEPGALLAPVGEDETADPPSAPWRIGAAVTIALSGVAFLIVAAALVVGLLTTGISP